MMRKRHDEIESVHDGVVISNLAPDLHLFVFSFSSRPEIKTSPNLFSHPSPVYMFQVALFTPFPPRPFLLFYVTLPLIRGPRNFASFSAVWPQQPPWMVSLVVVVYFNFVRLFALPRAEFDCVFSASFIRSHRFVLFVINCIFAVNTIQCSDCCRVGRQNLCLSFLSNRIQLGLEPARIKKLSKIQQGCVESTSLPHIISDKWFNYIK